MCNLCRCLQCRSAPVCVALSSKPRAQISAQRIKVCFKVTSQLKVLHNQGSAQHFLASCAGGAAPVLVEDPGQGLVIVSGPRRASPSKRSDALQHAYAPWSAGACQPCYNNSRSPLLCRHPTCTRCVAWWPMQGHAMHIWCQAWIAQPCTTM